MSEKNSEVLQEITDILKGYFDLNDLLSNVKEEYLNSNPKISIAMKNLVNNIVYIDEESNDVNGSLGHTIFAKNTKIYVNTGRELVKMICDKFKKDYQCDETTALSMILMGLKELDTPENQNKKMIYKSKFNEVEKVWIGIFMHELAHVIADDAIFAMVQGACNEYNLRKYIHDYLYEAQYEGKLNATFKYSDEFVEKFKKILNDSVKRFMNINILNQDDLELIDIYSKTIISNTPYYLSKDMSRLYNILVDIYIENAIGTVLPPNNGIINLREISRDVDNARAAVISSDSDLDKTINILKSDIDISQKDKTFYFSIVGKYIDPRHTFKEDILDLLKDTPYKELLLREAIDSDNIEFKYVDIKGSKPTYLDLINEMRAINTANYQKSLNLTNSYMPSLSYDVREKEGISGRSFAKIFNSFINITADDYMKIKDLLNEYNEKLDNVKKILGEAAEKTNSKKINKSLKSIIDEKFNKKYSATDIIEDLEELLERDDMDVSDDIHEAIRELEDMKYKISKEQSSNRENNQSMPPLAPDEIEEDNSKSKDNNSKDRDNSSNSSQDKGEGQSQPDQNNGKENSNTDQGQSQDQGQNQSQDQSGQSQSNQDNSGNKSGNQNKSLGDRLSETMDRNSQRESAAKKEDVTIDDIKNSEHSTYDKLKNEDMKDSSEIEEYLKEKNSQMTDQLVEQLKEVIEEKLNAAKKNMNYNNLADITELMEKRDDNSLPLLKKKIEEINNIDSNFLDRYKNTNNFLSFKDENIVNYLLKTTEPITSKIIEVWEKTLDSMEGKALFYDQMGTRGIAETGLKAKTTGVFSGQRKKESLFTPLLIDIVLDGSGSMSSDMVFEDDTGKKIECDYMTFAKAIIAMLSKTLSMYGITINVCTFGGKENTFYEPISSVTFDGIEGKGVKKRDAEEHNNNKLTRFLSQIYDVEPYGGTYQSDSLIQVIKNIVDKNLINYDKSPYISESQKSIIKMNRGKPETSSIILITDDDIYNSYENKNHIIKKWIDSGKSISLIRMCDNAHTLTFNENNALTTLNGKDDDLTLGIPFDVVNVIGFKGSMTLIDKDKKVYKLNNTQAIQRMATDIFTNILNLILKDLKGKDISRNNLQIDRMIDKVQKSIEKIKPNERERLI